MGLEGAGSELVAASSRATFWQWLGMAPPALSGRAFFLPPNF